MSGFHVYTTSGGQAAFAELCAARYDVALLDVSMPGVSGYEIAMRIREWSAERRPVLVAMTGWGREEDRVRALVCGFDRHMAKPVALDDLKELFASVPARGGPARVV
jgi:DNA-binding response OmpR family regulator